MDDSARPDWATERTEYYITIGFVLIGAGFLVGAFVTGVGQLEVATEAWNNPGDRDPLMAVIHELNHQVLAFFIGAILFASGVLRWRE